LLGAAEHGAFKLGFVTLDFLEGTLISEVVGEDLAEGLVGGLGRGGVGGLAEVVED